MSSTEQIRSGGLPIRRGYGVNISRKVYSYPLPLAWPCSDKITWRLLAPPCFGRVLHADACMHQPAKPVEHELTANCTLPGFLLHMALSRVRVPYKCQPVLYLGKWLTVMSLAWEKGVGGSCPLELSSTNLIGRSRLLLWIPCPWSASDVSNHLTVLNVSRRISLNSLLARRCERRNGLAFSFVVGLLDENRPPWRACRSFKPSLRFRPAVIIDFAECWDRTE